MFDRLRMGCIQPSELLTPTGKLQTLQAVEIGYFVWEQRFLEASLMEKSKKMNLGRALVCKL